MESKLEQMSLFVESFSGLLSTLQPEQTGRWGKMNAQQMVEHLVDVFDVSNGKINAAIETPPEYLERAKAFLMSDKLFRENTKGPSSLVPEEPRPLKHNNMEAAIHELESSIQTFFQFFREHEQARTNHPAFGSLNFEEWIQAHHKHLVHHARQFGLINES